MFSEVCSHGVFFFSCIKVLRMNFVWKNVKIAIESRVSALLRVWKFWFFILFVCGSVGLWEM